MCAAALLAAACATGTGGPIEGGPDASTIDFPDASTGGPPDAMNPPNGPDAAPQSVTLSQTTSNAITLENSASCNVGDPDYYHQENHYYRIYNLPSEGVNSAFNVTSVDVGIEQAVSAGGTQPATVKLHTVTGSPALANLAQIASAPVTVSDQSQAVLNVPITATVPAGSQLAVEFMTPDGTTAMNSLFIGSNTSGESAPGYIVAPASGCDITEMTTTATIGFATMHMVLNVSGTYNP